MSLEYLFSPTKQFTYPSGKLLDGGKVYVYFKDTTDLATLYSPEGSFVSNPILLDANGRASVRADIEYQYRLEIYTNKDVLLYTCEAFCEGDGSGGFGFVIHDETLSGNGTASNPLGVINIPLAVEDSLTAYEDIVEGKNSLVLGVNGDWFTDTFGSALNDKVDWSSFSACCSAVKGGLDNKLDISAFDLSNYYNKQETNNLLDQRVDRYEFAQTMNWVDQTKQDKLEFGYDENSAISSINNSALAGGQGGGGSGDCPWISGAKILADTQTLTDNMIVQVLSSFTLSGNKNHCIAVKGGTYRFPNAYELGDRIATTNYFMANSAMSSYLPFSSFSSYTASIQNSLNSNWDYTTSAYNLSLNNFYNKLDISAFSSWSANLDLSGDYLPTSASGFFYPMTGNPSGFLTAHQSLTNYYTKTETSSKQQISAALQYISANAGKTYSGIDPIVVNNTTNQISAVTWSFSAGTGISFVDDNVNKVTRIDVTGGGGTTYTGISPIVVNNNTNQISAKGVSFGVQSPLFFVQDDNEAVVIGCSAGGGGGTTYTGDAQGALDEVYANSGIWLTAHQSLTDYYKKTETSSKQEISAALNNINTDIQYVSANAGKTYTGDDPIYVNNETNHIGITGESLSAGPNIDIFSSGGYVVISATGGGGGGGITYTGDAQGALDEVYANSGVWLTAHQSLADYQTTAAMTGYVSVSDYNAATARIAELEQVLQTYSGQWLLPNEGEE